MKHVRCQCPFCCIERWLNVAWLGLALGLLALVAVPLLMLFL